MENKIYSINGPVVTIKGKTDLEMMEMVYVGNARLVGEVIRMNDKETTIQVYEETGGLKAGEPVESTGGPLSVTLGPGILRNIYDGIQRPLPAIEQHMGSFIERGAHEPSLDESAKWDVTVTVKAGDTLTPGQIYATCPETPAIQHRCMVPPTISGTVTWVAANGCGGIVGCGHAVARTAQHMGRRLLAGIVPHYAKCFRHKRSPRLVLGYSMPGRREV